MPKGVTDYVRCSGSGDEWERACSLVSLENHDSLGPSHPWVCTKQGFPFLCFHYQLNSAWRPRHGVCKTQPCLFITACLSRSSERVRAQCLGSAQDLPQHSTLILTAGKSEHSTHTSWLRVWMCGTVTQRSLDTYWNADAPRSGVGAHNFPCS